MARAPTAKVLEATRKRQLPLFTEQNTGMKLVRLNQPVQASMSKTDLLLQCQYWASPTVQIVPEPTNPSDLNYALRFGRAFHKCMEIHLAYRGKKRPKFGVIAAKFEVEPERLQHFYERTKVFIDKLMKDRGWTNEEERLVEKKIVYDPFSDKMRFLESTGERDYSQRLSTEFPGTGDLAIVPKARKRLMVLDWKSGQSSYDAQDNGQLLSLALGLSRHTQVFEADVFIVRVNDDFIEPSPGLLTSKMLDEHRENLRHAIESALSLNPSMRPGSHCTKYYCPAITVCPAHAGPLSIKDFISGVMTPEQRGHQFVRYQAAKKLIEKMGDFWHDDIKMNGPIFLDRGQHVTLKPGHRENLSKASIRRAMNPVEAEAMIDALRSLNALEDTEYEQLFVSPDPASKRLK